MRSGRRTALLVLYTVVEWCVIAASFGCVFKAFPATHDLGITDVVILLGFVCFGSIVQIPGVGGGMQIVTVLVLTEFFGISLEAASGIALVLWIITFVVIVPLGLVLAFREGIHWRNLATHRGNGKRRSRPRGVRRVGKRKRGADINMTCPFCSHRQDRVIDSRGIKGRGRDPQAPGVPEVRAPLHHV